MRTPIVRDFVKALRVSLYDDKEMSESMSVRKAFGFYYRSAVIPILLSIAVLVLFGSTIAQYSSLGIGNLLGGAISSGSQFNLLYEFLFDLVMLLLFIPAAIAFETLFYHLMGKVLMRRFNGGIGSTATAVVYSFMPLVVMSWSFPVPILGTLAKLIGIMWGFIILVAALAKLHGTSVESVVLSMIVMSFIAGIVLIAVFLPVLILGLSSGIPGLPTSGVIGAVPGSSSGLSPSESAAYSWVPIPYSILQGVGSLSGGMAP